MATTFLTLDDLAGHLAGRTTHWITEPNVWGPHGERIQAGVGDVDPVLVPSGEPAKSLTNLEALLDTLIGRGVRRDHVIVGCGGGAVTDLAGLAASLVLRGVEHVLIPTTLLAQVDAAIGGKTAVNLTSGKNLCGTFHFPRAVVMDRGFLETLPPLELAGGKAEVLKTGFIAGGDLWDRVRTMTEPDDRLLRDLAAFKDALVERDPREQGERALLNLGHTAGHAWERLGFGGHGQCVAWGLQFAFRLARTIGEPVEDGLVTEIDDWISRHDLQTSVPDADEAAFFNGLRVDKKAGATLRWIIPVGPGRCHIRDDVPEDAVRTVLEDLRA